MLAEEVVPQAVTSLQTSSALDAANAIMRTMDHFPKVRSKTLSNGARVVGMAKVGASHRENKREMCRTAGFPYSCICHVFGLVFVRALE